MNLILSSYKSELKWFEGVWSRFKPGLGKDKKGVSGVDEKKLVEIGKNINNTQKFCSSQNVKENI